MNTISIHESFSRGTPDFPIELHCLDKNHPKYKMQFHWHKDYEIIRVCDGVLELQLNDKIHIIKAGDSVFVPGGIIHGATPENCIYQCLVFSPSVIYSTPKARAVIKTQINSPIIFSSEKIIDNIFEDFKNDSSPLKITGNLYLLMDKVMNMQPTSRLAPDIKIEKIKAALSYIESNYSENIALAELAAICGMNPNYFCRLFKTLTQETPINYITRYRIEKACEFMASGSTITETAYNCGFNDTSYFIRTFKKFMDVSPKKYQMQK